MAVKTVAQQDIQALHRVRSLAVTRRAAQINQIRGLLLEYGIKAISVKSCTISLVLSPAFGVAPTVT